ncbi:PutA NAD-dependent aldehyde dehydrogenases [Candidatus Nanopelagicaceae bacterium]
MAKSLENSFDSLNPATGDVIASYPIFSAEEVQAAVATARRASQDWRDAGFKGRRKVLLAWSKEILDRVEELAELISTETGKPHSDAKLEAALAAGHISWAARHAESVMRTSHRSPGILMANMSATVERSPVGVVGVIGPWNYPVFTPIGSIAYALAAGNTVVFKPSEYTPGVGAFIADTFRRVSSHQEVLLCITGLGETGKFLCESGVDKLAFTGSTKTAKIVAATCAATMTPVVLECGGKDAVLVAADADLKRAADATVWSAFSNAGQTCIGAERVYVDSKVADQFMEYVVELTKSIHSGAPGSGNYGPSTMPKQVPIIASHINDAIARGAKVLLGGVDSVHAPFVEPVILADVPEDSIAMTEETFGPTIAINRVKNMAEAIELSNASRYGLGASVWSKKYGRDIASQLHTGMVSVNSVIAFAAVDSVPFGGVKDSGYGRIHGPEGILEFTYPRTVVRARFQLPIAFTSFKRTESNDKLIVRVTKLLKGRLS